MGSAGEDDQAGCLTAVSRSTPSWCSAGPPTRRASPRKSWMSSRSSTWPTSRVSATGAPSGERAVRSPGRPDAPRILRVRRPPRGGPPADGRGPDGPGPTPRGRGRRVVGAGRRSGLPPVTSFDIPLRGPAGEPVAPRRTWAPHGRASLPPMLLDEVAGTLEVTVPVPGGRPRTVHIGAGRPGRARVEVRGRAPGGRAIASLTETLRRILNLEEDLSGFYAVAATDPELGWVTTAGRRGPGRGMAGPRVPHARGHGAGRPDLLPGRRPGRLPGSVPALTGADGGRWDGRSRGPARASAARRGRGGTTAGPPGPGAVRRRPRDADARAVREADPGLVDPADVRAAASLPPGGLGRGDRSPIPAVRALRRPGVLVLPHPGLGRGGLTGSSPPTSSASNPSLEEHADRLGRLAHRGVVERERIGLADHLEASGHAILEERHVDPRRLDRRPPLEPGDAFLVDGQRHRLGHVAVGGGHGGGAKRGLPPVRLLVGGEGGARGGPVQRGPRQTPPSLIEAGHEQRPSGMIGPCLRDAGEDPEEHAQWKEPALNARAAWMTCSIRPLAR